MKRLLTIFLSLLLTVSLLAGCRAQEPESGPEPAGMLIRLSDEEITVDGVTASSDPSQAVYTANDIIYYEEVLSFWSCSTCISVYVAHQLWKQRAEANQCKGNR
jgi:hypothetical protein